jgi:DNA polymerase-3 subunit delta'
MSDDMMAVKLPWQESQWQRLDSLLRSGKLPHALLFAGPSGVGKQRFVNAFAHYLMCDSPAQGMACGNCRQCVLNKAGSHPDLKWVAPEEKSKQIKIDQIRSLVETLGHTSQQGGYKIVVLAPAEVMNINAANALLKSLEEPAPQTLLMLLTDSPNQLLPTIRSRCQTIDFPLPAKNQSLTWLASLVTAQTPVELLLAEAAGRPLDALDLLENEGLERRNQLTEDYLSMLCGRVSALRIAEKWLDYDLKEILLWMAHKLSGLISHRVAACDIEIIGPSWAAVASKAEVAQLFALLDKVNQLSGRLSYGANPNKQLALEELLLISCEKFHAH